jgi:hypothetical protein
MQVYDWIKEVTSWRCIPPISGYLEGYQMRYEMTALLKRSQEILLSARQIAKA